MSLDPQGRGEIRGLIGNYDGIHYPPTKGLLSSWKTLFRRTVAYQQLVRFPPQGSSVDVCVQCSQLSFSWLGSLKGGGQKAWSITGRGTEEGTLGTYPTRGYKKTFARPGVKSIEATERACRSPTLFSEDMAVSNSYYNSSTVFRVRRRSDTCSMGSNGGLQRASSTTARSQGGTLDRTLGLSLSTPRRKRMIRGSLPTDCPPTGAWKRRYSCHINPQGGVG